MSDYVIIVGVHVTISPWGWSVCGDLSRFLGGICLCVMVFLLGYWGNWRIVVLDIGVIRYTSVRVNFSNNSEQCNSQEETRIVRTFLATISFTGGGRTSLLLVTKSLFSDRGIDRSATGRIFSTLSSFSNEIFVTANGRSCCARGSL